MEKTKKLPTKPLDSPSVLNWNVDTYHNLNILLLFFISSRRLIPLTTSDKTMQTIKQDIKRHQIL